MEPREKPKDPNDPRQYVAIPGEGRRFLTGIVVLLAIPIAVFWGVLSGTPSVATAHPIIAIVSIPAVLVMVFLFTMTRLGHGIINTVGIEEYVYRNVRGYRLACWLGDTPSTKGKLLFRVVPPSERRTDEVASPTLMIPLGGWFRRPMVFMPNGREPSRPLRRGQIRLRDPLFRFTLPEGAGQLENAIASHHIQLRDRQGDRVTVYMVHAFEMLEMHGALILTDPEYGLKKEVDNLRESAGRLTRERDAVQAQLTREGVASEHAHRMWRHALGAIEHAIRRIQASSRFGASIEALRIRVFLLEQFRNLVPAPRPEEPRLQEWCTWADEELGTARADLARRERHKSRPSAGTGA